MRRVLTMCVALTAASAACTFAAPAAEAAVRVSAQLPRSVPVRAAVSISGLVAGAPAGARAALQQRLGASRWRSLTTAGLARSGAFTLGWHAPARAATTILRVVVLARGRLLATTPGQRTLVHPPPMVAEPSAVRSLPPAGSAGTVVLAGHPHIVPGQALAVGYSTATPTGFLGRVTSAHAAGGNTTLQTVPTTLADVAGNGDLNLDNFTQVGTGARVGGVHAAGQRPSPFNQEIGKALSCEAGAVASLTGKLSLSLTPALHAHFSVFGLSSADFSLTGTASASLTANAAASASCKLDRTTLLAVPVHIATLSGSIGPVPVVIVLQGQVFVDAKVGGSAAVTSGIHASVSITGGISYAHGHFSPILTGPTPSVGFDPPTVSANGTDEAHVEPVLQMLLYGVAGPQLGVKSGLEFNADTTATPWWKVDVPLELNASLTAPDLGLDSGTLSLYKNTFNVGHATSPFGPAPPPPPPSPPSPPSPLPPPPPPAPAQVRHIDRYATTADVGCNLQTHEDSHDSFFTDSSSDHAACGTFLALAGTLYGPATTPAGDNLHSPTPWTAVSQTTSGSGTVNDPNTITTVVAAGDTGVKLTETDRWVTGGLGVDSTYAVTGQPGATDSIVLYRGGDCFTADNDKGAGSFDAATQTAGCVHDNGNGTSVTLALMPLSPGALSVEDQFDTVWSDIAAQTALPGSCLACAQTPDNGFATSWSVSLRGATPVSESSRFVFQ